MSNNKQDRQGVRTPADLERKYNWKKSFSELHEIAEGAQKTADGAKKDVVNLDNKLNQEEIFNRLTNNGELQGLYRDEDGNIYINADYIQSGKFTSTAKVFFEPTTEEVDLIMKYCVGEATIPADQIPLYDFNNDGTITVYDAMLAMWAAQGIQSLADWSGAQKTDLTLTIDPSNADKPISFTGTNMWGRTFERSFGWDDAFIKSTEGGIMYRLNGGEKEWLNPPFQADTEYRTTERYNSKVVYKKLDSETGHIMWRTEDETEWHDDTATEIEDTNTTYTLSKDGLRIVLTGSDGTTSSVLDAQGDSGMLESIDELTLRVDGIEQNAGKDGAGNDIVETYATKDALDGKADDSHTHSIADISNLQSTLDGKAAKSHTHDDLQLQIDDIQQNAGKDGSGNDIVETYATKDELSGKADSSHTHAALSLLDGATGNVQTQINNVRNLADDTSSRVDTIEQNAGKDGSGNDIVETYATKGELSGKANSSHTHAVSDVDGLQSTINGINNSINTLQSTVDDLDQNRGNYATKEDLEGKSDTGHTHSYNELTSKPTIPTKTSQLTNDSGFKTTDNNTTYELVKNGNIIALEGSDGSYSEVEDDDTKYSLGSFGITATAAELNYVDGVTSNIQTQLNGKTTRISLSNQCQLTDYRHSVIALCYAPTTASANNGSYTVGRISVARTNNLDAPKFADIAMGAAHGAIGRIRTRYTRTGFEVFEPCTFKYNGVLYGGVKFNPAPSCFTYVEFTGVTTFPIFALDVYRSDTKTVLNEEVYNSLSSSTVIVDNALYLGDYAFITGANIGSQSVASATKATQDGNGNDIVNTYATKSALNSLSGTVDNISTTVDDLDQNRGKDGSGNDIVETYATKSELSGKADSSHKHSYLPLSGGTVDGSVTIKGDVSSYSTKTEHYANAFAPAGWYRIYSNSQGNAIGKGTCTFTLGRSYYSPQNEEYNFSVSVGYNGQIDITQLSGVVGGHLIEKIRVVYKNSSPFYIDFYAKYSGNDSYRNGFYVHGFGVGQFQSPTLVSSVEDGYSTYEFTTVNGCKSDKGFTGSLSGNATSATTASNANRVFVNRSNANGYYPVMLTNIRDGVTSQIDDVYASYNNTVTLNPYAGALKANSFVGNATSATKATQDGNGNNIAATYATKGEVVSGTVVDITGSVSVYSSYGDHPIKKAVDTGSSILILFNGEQEFADINITFPFYLQSKLVVSAIMYGTNGAEDIAAMEGLFDVQLDAFWSSYCGYGSSLEIKYV